MGEVLVSPDGHRAERILVRRTLDGPAREMLRVKHGRYFVSDCAKITDAVAELLDVQVHNWRPDRHDHECAEMSASRRPIEPATR